MKKLKFAIYILIGILLLIQFIPIDRPKAIEGGFEFTASGVVPSGVGVMLKNACYDCHSDQVTYPWYSYVAPVSWLIIRDVNEGREHLNFSRWDMMTKKKKLKALEDIAEEVGEGEMPMKIYPPLHPKARLSDDDRQLIVDWADQLSDKEVDE